MKYKAYRVIAGDSITRIANKHNMRVEDLKTLNNLTGDNPVIHPGDTLKVYDTSVSATHAENILAQYANIPLTGAGACPLRNKISLFPVRYALDESPTTKNTNKGPNPVDKAWQGLQTYPDLQTRSYTLRQLRDGWLYVWEDIDKKLYEYTVQGHLFTLIALTDQHGKQEPLTEQQKTAKSYLEFAGYSHLYMAYSSVQCTNRIKQQLAKHNSRWMREINLINLCQGQVQPHTQLITELAHFVADISGTNTTYTPNFNTTTLSTTHKPIIAENTIKSAVPDVKDSLLVALDDPLAVIDDLTMNLIGRWSEQAAFEEKNQHKLNIANNCLTVLGTDYLTSNIKDERIKKDPVKLYQCIADINRYYTDMDSINSLDYANADLYGYNHKGKVELENRFKEKWKFTPNETSNFESWKERAILRDDIRCQEMLTFLSQSTEEKQRYNQHIKKSEQDLLVWLNQLNTDITQIFYDNLEKTQTQTLLEKTNTLYSFIVMTDQGKGWLAQQCKAPSSVLGLAIAVFDKDLYLCIKKIAAQQEQKANNSQVAKPSHIDDQWIIDNIANNDNLGTLRYIDASTLLNVFSRTGEVQSAYDLVIAHEEFKKLAETSRQAFAVQRALSSWTATNNIMQHIEYKVLTAVAYDNLSIFEHGMFSFVRQDQLPGRTVKLGINTFHKWLIQEIPYFRNRISKQLTDCINLMKKAALNHIVLPLEQYKLLPAQMNKLKQLLTHVTVDKAPLVFVELNFSQVISSGDIKAHNYSRNYFHESPQYNIKYTNIPKEALQLWDLPAEPTPATRMQQVKIWIEGKGGLLPMGVLALNLYNLKKVNDTAAQHNYDNDAKIALASAIGYTANAITALYIMPYWSKYALSIPLAESGKGIAQLSINAWKTLDQLAVAKIATRLAIGMAAFSAFALIGSGFELYQVASSDYVNATSTEEKGFLFAKMGALTLMSAISATQLIGAALAPWVSFGWILSTPIGIAIAVIGVLYLLFSLGAAYYKRSGIRLWLHRCTWGRDCQWQDNETDHKKELHVLYKALLQPSVHVKRVNTFKERIGIYPLSMWVAIQVPAQLSGHTITLDSILANGETTPPTLLRKGSQAITLDSTQWLTNGRWIASPAAGETPELPFNKPISNEDVSYTSQDPARIWLTKLEYSHTIQTEAQTNKDINIELKITYPDALLGGEEIAADNSYIFTTPLYSTSDATTELKTDYYDNTKQAEATIINQHSKTAPARIQTLTIATAKS